MIGYPTTNEEVSAMLNAVETHEQGTQMLLLWVEKAKDDSSFRQLLITFLASPEALAMARGPRMGGVT